MKKTLLILLVTFLFISNASAASLSASDYSGITYEGNITNCNAGIVTNNSNLRGCATHIIGYFLNLTSPAEFRGTPLYVYTSGTDGYGQTMVGIITTLNLANTSLIGYTLSPSAPTEYRGHPLYSVSSSSPWYGEVSRNAAHQNQSTNAIGYLVTIVSTNGACGSANGASLTTAPTNNLCNIGTHSNFSGSGPWTWDCLGINSGTTASCSATKISATITIDGACGTSHNLPTSSAPSTGLCAQGTPSTISGSGPWSWTCNEIIMTNGVCGTTSGNCASGTPSSDNGSTVCGTTRTWSCDGSNGGSTATCSVSNPSCATNGVCGTANGTVRTTAPSGSALCASGTASSVTYNTGVSWTWTCNGSSGGVNDTCEAEESGGGGGGGGCFAAGTLILMADGTEKDILNIKVGDMVMSYDKSKPNSKLVPKRVTHYFDAGIETIFDINGAKVTDTHPFMTSKGVVTAGNLKADDKLIDLNGKQIPIKRKKIIGKSNTYNFTVETYHSYIANGYRVGNIAPAKPLAEGYYKLKSSKYILPAAAQIPVVKY